MIQGRNNKKSKPKGKIFLIINNYNKKIVTVKISKFICIFVKMEMLEKERNNNRQFWKIFIILYLFVSPP